MIDDDEDAVLATPPPDWANRVLHFWFVESSSKDWFGGGPEFDAKVEEALAIWRESLRGLPVDTFLADAKTALAAVLLFDQVPRNTHRGSAEAFATDHMALAISRQAIEQGFDAGLSKNERLFLYLPFEHSEDRDDQREAVRLISGLGDADLLKFALDHQAMIERFGRFPHRNAALGRPDRPGEAEAVAAGNHW